MLECVLVSYAKANDVNGSLKAICCHACESSSDFQWPHSLSLIEEHGSQSFKTFLDTYYRMDEVGVTILWWIRQRVLHFQKLTTDVTSEITEAWLDIDQVEARNVSNYHTHWKIPDCDNSRSTCAVMHAKGSPNSSIRFTSHPLFVSLSDRDISTICMRYLEGWFYIGHWVHHSWSSLISAWCCHYPLQANGDMWLEHKGWNLAFILAVKSRSNNNKRVNLCSKLKHSLPCRSHTYTFRKKWSAV